MDPASAGFFCHTHHSPSVMDAPTMRITLIFLFLFVAANLGLSLADWMQQTQDKRMDAMCQANPTLCK